MSHRTARRGPSLGKAAPVSDKASRALNKHLSSVPPRSVEALLEGIPSLHTRIVRHSRRTVAFKDELATVCWWLLGWEAGTGRRAAIVCASVEIPDLSLPEISKPLSVIIVCEDEDALLKDAGERAAVVGVMLS